MPVSQSNPTIGNTFNFRERLRQISMFFDGTDKVHQTMRRVAEKFEEARIPYALVGGMAVNAHNHRRTTGGVDFLVTTSGLAEFIRRFNRAEIGRSSPQGFR